jgi:hypothetical protein
VIIMGWRIFIWIMRGEFWRVSLDLNKARDDIVERVA